MQPELRNRLEAPVGLVPMEHAHRRSHLVHAIRGHAVGMKVQGAWAKPGLRMPLSMRSELRRCSVQAVDVDAISAQIVDKCETVVGRERSEMRVRALLAIFVGPMLRILLGPHGSAQ